MAARTCCVSLLIICLHSVLGAPQAESLHPKGVETRYCAFYNGSQPTCDPNDPTCVSTVQREECQPSDNDKSSRCFQQWYYNSTTNSSTLRLKGCVLDTVSYDKERSYSCPMHNFKLQLIALCCEGDMCNSVDLPPGSLQPIPAWSTDSTRKIPGFDEIGNNAIVLESNQFKFQIALIGNLTMDRH